MSGALKKKQQYLVSEIIEKGHDAQKFTQFMESEREDGGDIANWSFSSLQEAVEKFVRGSCLEQDEENYEPTAQPSDPVSMNQHLANVDHDISHCEEQISDQKERARSESSNGRMKELLEKARQDKDGLTVHYFDFLGLQ